MEKGSVLFLLQEARTYKSKLLCIEGSQGQFKLEQPSGQVSEPLGGHTCSHPQIEDISNSSICELRKKLVGKCPLTLEKMAGVEAWCLVDSGSEVTTVTESFYNKCLRDSKLQNTFGWVLLKAAN